MIKSLKRYKNGLKFDFCGNVDSAKNRKTRYIIIYTYSSVNFFLSLKKREKNKIKEYTYMLNYFIH